ncbi:MAG TPA: glycosyltransferase [Segeticoccus sp.]|uniref:glycosyltransferase n=1 Tax=Segeticoccus sp. TaxID=2706531 RepID=UPI002D7E2A1A|nr:glycosyltransferase [Segeticoccus sp.]HET8598971.1 glycosyltransferase [Segeticoccus sp.]
MSGVPGERPAGGDAAGERVVSGERTAAGGRTAAGERSAYRATLYQWAQVPGPVGGVTTSVEALTAAVSALGAEVVRVNTAAPPQMAASLPRLWRRRALHLLHITNLYRAILVAPVMGAVPGRTAVVLHSGSTRGQLERMSPWLRRAVTVALHAYDEIWAVNGEIREVLPGVLRGRVRVVSPYVPPASVVSAAGSPSASEAAAAGPPRDLHLVTVATNSGQHYYGADVAIDAVARVRRSWPEARLWVLGYDRDGAEMAALRRRAAELDWVDISFNLGPSEVTDALRRSGVFLRPTSWDGDSVIVREALACGARVVASDVAPRPAGVEVAPLDAEALAAAVLDGGRASDGAGLASETILDAARDALGLAAPPGLVAEDSR